MFGVTRALWRLMNIVTSKSRSRGITVLARLIGFPASGVDGLEFCGHIWVNKRAKLGIYMFQSLIED